MDLKTLFMQVSLVCTLIVVVLFYHETLLGKTNGKYIVRETVIKFDKYKEIRDRIKRDNLNIRKVCAKYLGSRNPWLPVKPNLNVYYYYLDKVKKLGWCVNAKAGSSTVKLILMYTSRKFNNNTLKYSEDAKHLPQLHSTFNHAFKLHQNISKSADPAKVLNSVLTNEDIFSFSFVRHPYTRIVSAYEDKVLGRSENGEIFGSLKNKTFPQFIDLILREWRGHQCNEHWQPQYMHCDFCEINYDIIGRVESLEDDLKYIAHMNNFSSLLPEDKNKFHVHPSGGDRFSPAPDLTKSDLIKAKRKTEKVKRYFSKLNPSQLKGLYNMYQIDFELFGYTENPYVSQTS